MENKFYKAEPKVKFVTESEFDEFLKNYPRNLEKNVSGISSPPAISYNDFELANRWPYSVVASTFMYSDTPGDLFYCPKSERAYRIVENYNELFESKTGYTGDD